MILVYLFASCMARTFFLFPIILFVSLLLITLTCRVGCLFMNVNLAHGILISLDH